MSAAAKTCFKCDQEKPLSEFCRHGMMADGHLNKCKDCAKRDIRQHRLEHPERVRNYDVDRSKLAYRKAKREAYAKAFVRENPEKKAAHTAVGNAVRDGRLKKLPCAFCGTPDPVEAHHHDYSKPLDVTWLCKPCHRRFHALERMATYRDAA